MKEFLSHAGVPYTVHDVDQDLDAYDRLIALGFRTVPVTLVGGTSIVGFDAEALAAALQR